MKMCCDNCIIYIFVLNPPLFVLDVKNKKKPETKPDFMVSFCRIELHRRKACAKPKMHLREDETTSKRANLII